MFNQINVHEAKKKMEEGAILIDVREDWEYEKGHVSGSRWIPLAKLKEESKDLDKEKEYLLMCKMGGRSQRASEWLSENGFGKVSNVQGGIMDWADEIDENVVEDY